MHDPASLALGLEERRQQLGARYVEARPPEWLLGDRAHLVVAPGIERHEQSRRLPPLSHASSRVSPRAPPIAPRARSCDARAASSPAARGGVTSPCGRWSSTTRSSGSGTMSFPPPSQVLGLTLDELVEEVPREHEVVVRLPFARDSSSETIGMCVPIVSEPHLSGFRSAAHSISESSIPTNCRIVLPFVEAPYTWIVFPSARRFRRSARRSSLNVWMRARERLVRSRGVELELRLAVAEAARVPPRRSGCAGQAACVPREEADAATVDVVQLRPDDLEPGARDHRSITASE